MIFCPVLLYIYDKKMSKLLLLILKLLDLLFQSQFASDIVGCLIPDFSHWNLVGRTAVGVVVLLS